MHMKFFYNQTIHYYYDFPKSLAFSNSNQCIWIYRLFRCLDQEIMGTRYKTIQLIDDIQNPSFAGIGFDFDISIDRDPKNRNTWYIYYPDPVIASPAARDSEGNFLLWDEDKIFDILTPDNSLQLSQQNLLELLFSWHGIINARPIKPFLLVWKHTNNWFYIQSFTTELDMNNQIKNIS